MGALRTLGLALSFGFGCALASGCARQAAPVTHHAALRSAVQAGLFARELASSRPVGRGARFRPPALGAGAARATAIDGMACRHASPVVAAAHLELFAAGRVVIVPAGIGVDPPLRIRGAAVRGGRCVYPLRTLDPTGLILLGPGHARTLGELFDVWGQPLSPTTMAGFRTSPHQRVSVFVGGALWHGDPTAVPLRPTSQVTVEVGAYVSPHARYTFPSLAWARS